MAARDLGGGMDGLKAAFGSKKRIVPRKIAIDKTIPTLNELALRAVVSQVRNLFSARQRAFRRTSHAFACVHFAD